MVQLFLYHLHYVCIIAKVCIFQTCILLLVKIMVTSKHPTYNIFQLLLDGSKNIVLFS